VKIADYGVTHLLTNHDALKQHRIAWYALSIG